MDYKKHYNLLIDRATTRLFEGYTEQHHIIPRCMGGGNESDNLVKLTAEEHYVAHQLLIKIYPNNHKLIYAANMMTLNSHGQRINNRLYGWMKKQLSATISQSNKTRTVSIETRRKKSLSMKGKNTSPLTIEHKRKLSAARMGKKHSSDTKKKISDSSVGKSGFWTGKKRGPMSEEQKQKISITLKTRNNGV